MSALGPRFGPTGDAQVFAGEVLTVELAFTDGTVETIALDGRVFALTIFNAKTRQELVSVAGEVMSDASGSYVRFAIDGDTTEDLFANYGALRLRVEIAELLDAGRDIWVEGALRIRSSAAGVVPATSVTTGPPVSRFVYDYSSRRTIVSARGAPGLSAATQAFDPSDPDGPDSASDADFRAWLRSGNADAGAAAGATAGATAGAAAGATAGQAAAAPYATTATTQAGIATTKAGEAVTNAVAAETARLRVETIANAGVGSVFLTWAALSATTAAANTGAIVIDADTGTHTDPVVGGTVANGGVYRYSTSPAGWQRVASSTAAQAAASAATATNAAANLSAILVPNKNKFNPSGTALANSQFSAAGALQTNAGFTATAFIDYVPALPSTSYVSNSAFGATIVWYDAAKAVIGAASYTIANSVPRVSPAGTAFYRISFNTGSIDPATFQIEIGSTPTSFESYRLAIAGTALPIPVIMAALKALPDLAGPIAQTDILVPGKNKFNPNGTALANSQFSAAGALQTNAGFTATAFIDYVPSLPNTSYVSNSAFGATIVWYDAAKAVIGAASYTIANSVPRVSPAGTAFYRISFNTGSIDPATFQIEIGSTATAFEAFKLVLSAAALPALTTALYGDGSVTPAKTTFLVPGKNKFNPNGTALANSQFSAAGALQTNAGFTATAFIDYVPALPSTSYVSNSAFGATIVWYDAAKAVIGAASYTIANSVPRVSPAGTAFYRISLFTGSIDPATFQIEVGSVSSYFEPYALAPVNGPTPAQVSAALRWAANDLALPRKKYLLKATENNFYHLTLQRRSVDRLFFTRMSGSVGGASIASYDNFSRITPSATGTGTLTATLLDGNFDPIVTKTTAAIVTDAVAPSAATTFLAIGDSYLEIGAYLWTLGQTVSGVTMVGTRKLTRVLGQGATWSGFDIRFEGRSGADLGYLFTAIKSPGSGASATGFSPFISPPGYNFIGNTNSWKSAASGSPSVFVSSLATTAGAFRGGFSASTGYPATPQTNDLLWDDTAAAFKAWDGSAWQTVAVDTATFTFDFARYLTLWGVRRRRSCTSRWRATTSRAWRRATSPARLAPTLNLVTLSPNGTPSPTPATWTG